MDMTNEEFCFTKENVVIRELTKRRIQLVLDYVNHHIAEHGYPPSVREICAALNFKSTSTVHIYLKRLAEEGKIKKAPAKPRAMRVMEGSGAAAVWSSFSPKPESDTVHVPVVGRVTAGKPVLAVENIEYTFPVPSFFVNDAEAFMLRVEGDSMVNAGIFDQDYILVRQQPTAINGEIVVALVGEEATVKTFYKERNRIRLQPENERYDPIYAGANCSIVGKVVGIFRKL